MLTVCTLVAYRMFISFIFTLLRVSSALVLFFSIQMIFKLCGQAGVCFWSGSDLFLRPGLVMTPIYDMFD